MFQTSGCLYWKLKDYQRERKESKTLLKGYVKQALIVTERGRDGLTSFLAGLGSTKFRKGKKQTTKTGITPWSTRKIVNDRMILDKLNTC